MSTGVQFFEKPILGSEMLDFSLISNSMWSKVLQKAKFVEG